ncbi:hypothetical protein LJC60_08195 [Ruminococcaceae bacterium OttesenSCG-928-D13]|nr:hypothetical protein [Ruminococcaceae bacterium OttesenSCG-928-D13]
MPKSKKPKYKKRTPAAKRPPTQQLFDPTEYTDAKTLVKAYFEYALGISYNDYVTKVLCSPTTNIRELLEKNGTRSMEEETELLNTNKEYAAWVEKVSIWKTADRVIAILTNDSPEVWNILNIDTLNYARAMTGIPLTAPVDNEGLRSFVENVAKMDDNKQARKIFDDNWDEVVFYFHQFKMFK